MSCPAPCFVLASAIAGAGSVVAVAAPRCEQSAVVKLSHTAGRRHEGRITTKIIDENIR